MTATISLKQIQDLRKRHTLAFMACDYQAMQKLDTRIKLAWENHERLCAGRREQNQCFNCTATADSRQKVDRPGRNPLLFCSANCRAEYGIELGLT